MSSSQESGVAKLFFEPANAGRRFEFDLVRVKFAKPSRSIILKAEVDDDPPTDISTTEVAAEIAKRLKIPDTKTIAGKIHRIIDPPVSLDSILVAIRGARTNDPGT